MWNEAIIGAMSGGAVLLIGKIGEILLSWRKSNREQEKQKAETSIPINDQAVLVYKDIVDSLRTDIKKLNRDLETLDKLYMGEREARIALKGENENLKLERDYYKSRCEKTESEKSKVGC